MEGADGAGAGAGARPPPDDEFIPPYELDPEPMLGEGAGDPRWIEVAIEPDIELDGLGLIPPTWFACGPLA